VKQPCPHCGAEFQPGPRGHWSATALVFDDDSQMHVIEYMLCPSCSRKAEQQGADGLRARQALLDHVRRELGAVPVH
jgi:phage terminase large subunit GpA-like protein